MNFLLTVKKFFHIVFRIRIDSSIEIYIFTFGEKQKRFSCSLFVNRNEKEILHEYLETCCTPIVNYSSVIIKMLSPFSHEFFEIANDPSYLYRLQTHRRGIHRFFLSGLILKLKIWQNVVCRIRYALKS